jgi:hypothetical protein
MTAIFAPVLLAALSRRRRRPSSTILQEATAKTAMKTVKVCTQQ